MRFKFTVFLLSLNIITFGLILYLDHQSKDIDSSGLGLSGRIGQELVEADRIELRSPSTIAPFVLKRAGSTWSIIEPIQWSANYFAINRILNQLQFLEEEASFTIEEIEKTGQSLADYGLDDPALTLVVGEGDASITLSIGTSTEIGNNYYLLGPDRREIFVISGEVINGLWVSLNDLRTREIFDIPVFEVDALGLQIRTNATNDGSYLKVRLAKNNETWAFEAPLSANADPALVENTINTLTAVKVERFIEGAQVDPLLQGLESPFMQVTIHGNKRRQTLFIGNPDPMSVDSSNYFAKLEDNPAVFTVSARPFNLLKKAQEDLRERNFISFNPATLSAINISENDRKIRLQKLETGNHWQVLESTENVDIQPHRADPEIIGNLLENLAMYKANNFAVDAPTPTDNERLGFNTPRRIVTLSFTEGDPLVLSLAQPEDNNDNLYAKTNRAEFIYEVDSGSTLRMFPLDAMYYRNRTLDTLANAARIETLELIDLASGNKIIDLKLDENTPDWTNLLEKLEPNTASHVQVLLASVRSFKVKNYLFDRYEEAYSENEKTLPWAYKLNASIVLPGGETALIEKREYVFTKRISGTIQVGGAPRNNSMFEIPQALLETIYELTEDMILPPEALDQVVPEPTAGPDVAKPVQSL